MSDERHGNPHTSGAVDPVGQGELLRSSRTPVYRRTPRVSPT
ncbi:hypothetical protein ACFODP_09265 [Pseudoglutamicibacter albus]